MRRALSILKPEVKTKYLRNIMMEKVRYLEVPQNVKLADLKRDIKNGAVHMKEVAELLEKKTDPKYIVITASTEEQGLLAVSYLAACFNSENPPDEELDEELGSDTPDMPDISVDEFGDPVCEEECWSESDYKIPIVDFFGERGKEGFCDVSSDLIWSLGTNVTEKINPDDYKWRTRW